MNRIYQGKVTNVEAESDETPLSSAAIQKGKKGCKPLPDWQDALWQHHQLFQDAVNYYTLALAALA